MKTAKLSTIFLCAFLSLSAFGQTAETKKTNDQKEIVFSTQNEKDACIKKMEDKLKIDLIDATYPSADLEKQKQELAKAKKTKITPSNK
jgi:hypothetical protein